MPPEVAEELEPSPSSETQDVESESPSDSSDVAQSLEDAILAVVPISDDVEPQPESDPEDLTPDSSPDGEETGSAEVSDDPPPEAAELDDDAKFIELMRDKDIPLGKIERFQELITDRQELRTQNEELRVITGQLDELTDHARKAGMDDEQMANWYSMPVLLANDPEKAYELIKGFVDELDQRRGATLPDELQKRVDEGYMDEDSAKELARARADLAERERRGSYDEKERQTQAHQASVTSIREAVNTREQHYRTTDPDYSPDKHKFVQNELLAMVRENGAPKTPEEATQWANKAHETVTAFMGKMKAPPKPARTLTGRGTNRPSAPEPKTMLEAISAALDNVSED